MATITSEENIIMTTGMDMDMDTVTVMVTDTTRSSQFHQIGRSVAHAD